MTGRVNRERSGHPEQGVRRRGFDQLIAEPWRSMGRREESACWLHATDEQPVAELFQQAGKVQAGQRTDLEVSPS